MKSSHEGTGNPFGVATKHTKGRPRRRRRVLAENAEEEEEGK